jgi:hypothetical protein
VSWQKTKYKQTPVALAQVGAERTSGYGIGSLVAKKFNQTLLDKSLFSCYDDV